MAVDLPPLPCPVPAEVCDTLTEMATWVHRSWPDAQVSAHRLPSPGLWKITALVHDDAGPLAGYTWQVNERSMAHVPFRQQLVAATWARLQHIARRGWRPERG